MADKKKRIRAGHRASATRMVRQIEEALTTDPPDKSRLAVLTLALKEKRETLTTLDAEIADQIEDEAAMADDIEQADDFKQTLYAALLKADKLLQAPAAAVPTLTSATPSATPPATATPSSKASTVRLPKLQLRHYNGDLTKWTSFWQSFQAAVDNNPDLSGVEKFNYLSSLLEGTAREAVAGLSLTDANYTKAVTTLQKRFGGTQQIVSKHMEALLQIETVSSPQNVKALRRLYDNISSHIRSLESLDVKEETYGNLLCPILITKIPAELQLIVSRKVPDAEWKLKQLMAVVEEEIIARERLGRSKSPRRNDGKPPPTATALLSGESSSTTRTCCYCDQQHHSTECAKVTQVDARKQLLRKGGRCFSCLRKGHISKHCRSSRRCQTCNGKHHTSICTGTSIVEESRARNNAAPTTPVETTTSNLNPSALEFQPPTSNPQTSTLYINSGKSVLLQTASTVIYNPHDPSVRLRLRIVMDSGSQRSYLTHQAQRALHLKPIDQLRLAIAAFGSKRVDPCLCDVVRVRVETKVGEDKEVDLFVVPHICEPLTEQPIGKCVKPFAHITGLELADDPRDETRGIDMLLGSDFYWEFVTGETRRGKNGPIAINTTLGWVLSGPAAVVRCHDAAINLITVHTLRVDDGVSNKMLDATMRSFWDLESLGIRPELSEDNVSNHFASSVQMKGGRYEVSLPWRECHDPLPTNYELSRRRLIGILRRLRRSPDILKEYDLIIKTQREQGIVEVVDDQAAISGVVHYLPHHAIIRQDKTTTKVRVVYDASARSSGPSLNDCLHVGPKFNQRINDLLFRFRSYPVALVADIEKAFLMISVNPCDRDALRFLWVENPFNEECKLTTLRFARVVFGISSSPYLLNATVKHHLEKYRSSKPDLVELLSRSTYVDDIIVGAESEGEAFSLYVDAKEVFGYGSFNLRKFLTNSFELQHQIDRREAAMATDNAGHYSPEAVQSFDESFSEVTLPTNCVSHPGEHKVLGVRWNVKDDLLVFDLSSLAEKAAQLRPTKRNVVSIIGQIYDPLGYLSPVIVTFKVLMQDVCKTKVSWDQPLEGEPLSKWRRLIKSLRESRPLRLKRHYFDGQSANEVQLYGFCDASNAAYAAVIYIADNSEPQVPPRFVVSKTRVSPLKSQTIPRLELLSALLLARLISNVVESLGPRFELRHIRCFTDSQVVLCWVRGIDRDWKAFVQNRVQEIRRLVPPQLWNHCPGTDNPADIPSRGLDPTDLSSCKLWKHGPEWLCSTFLHSPMTSENDVPEQCWTELKAGKAEVSHSLLAPHVLDIGLVINIERFSTTTKLYRVTAYSLKFLQLLRRQATSPQLTQQDLVLAGELWIKEAQKNVLKNVKFSTWKTQFGMFQDERGIWRCGGRLQNTALPYSAKHPIFLGKKHYFTNLCVREAHCRVQHNGVRETLTELRSKYWIVGGRSYVRSIIYGCVVCKRYEGRPLQGPPQPPLPEFRVKESPPFTHTAVDFAGPLYLRGRTSNDSVKAWICLFTCCVSRAIHLELVLDMTTATFIRCVKRFAARRGLPHSFLSDNAKTFKGAAKSLKAMCSHPDTRDYLSNSGVEWKFNLERAPWWGGVFERLIKSTKRCLRKVIGTARFSYDEMHTAVVEIEAIVNSRPLSYVYPDDFQQPLTPSHLLVGRRLLSLPDHLTYVEPEGDEDFELSTESLQRRAKHLSSVLNHFWRRWSQEYLLELRDAHRHRGPKNPSTPISVGAIVLVHDDDNPRGFWKVARVDRLISGRDSLVRGAILKVGSKSGTATTLQRPLQRLYPLEISSNDSQAQEQSADEEEPVVDSNPVSDSNPVANSNIQEPQAASRPLRKAAIKARDRVKQWCAEDLVDHT